MSVCEEESSGTRTSSIKCNEKRKPKKKSGTCYMGICPDHLKWKTKMSACSVTCGKGSLNMLSFNLFKLLIPRAFEYVRRTQKAGTYFCFLLFLVTCSEVP